ncbi:MAG: zinc ribbon domain-containing protein [Anaerolineales bacterium]|nr:zinc ribbon domain-containing protein [Anaerolineales bacterium]
MPLYEYRCQSCQRQVSIRMSYSEYDRGRPKCSHCLSDQLQRMISRVRVSRSEDSRMDALADPANFGDVDENDPRSIGKFMRRMGNEMGEDMGPEFDEMVGRLEAGEDPESVEADMPDLSGPADGPAPGF